MILAGPRHAQGRCPILGEARAIAKLQHRHIVQIYSIGEAEGLPFFELEYRPAAASTSDSTARPGCRSVRRAWSRSWRSGMAEAHCLGIVHRDLKPAKFSWPPTARPRSPTSAWPGPSARIGPHPERLDPGLTKLHGARAGRGLHQASRTSRRHLRARGGPLRAATGRPPFRGATVLETLEQVKGSDPVPPSRLVLSCRGTSRPSVCGASKRIRPSAMRTLRR